MSINRAILLGNVGADPEIRSTGSGDKVATLRLATSERWKDKNTGERKETTDWHTVVIWNQAIVGVVEEYVTKGSKISVQGAIKTRKWQDQDGKDRYSTEIVVGRFDGNIGLEGTAGGGQSNRDEHGYGTTRDRSTSTSGGDDAGQGGFGDASFGRTGGGQDATGRSTSHPIDDEIPF